MGGSLARALSSLEDRPHVSGWSPSREERDAALAAGAVATAPAEWWEAVFGRVAASALVGTRATGKLRGLLRLEVPLDGLHEHREREARFMAAVEADPVLTHIRLVYVIGPESD